MNARYWQKGETLDYTATEKAVTNGQVVSLGGRIGVAGNDIAKGETGALHVTGVFIMEKAASVTVTMGAALYFDESEEKITTVAAGNVPAGYAAADAHYYPVGIALVQLHNISSFKVRSSKHP